jgi:hypothetical protein
LDKYFTTRQWKETILKYHKIEILDTEAFDGLGIYCMTASSEINEFRDEITIKKERGYKDLNDGTYENIVLGFDPQRDNVPFDVKRIKLIDK